MTYQLSDIGHRAEWSPKARTAAQTIADALRTDLLRSESMATPINGSDLRSFLRTIYSETGGNRNAYNPSSGDLRSLYNGATTGAKLVAAANGNGTSRAAPQPSIPVPVEAVTFDEKRVAGIVKRIREANDPAKYADAIRRRLMEGHNSEDEAANTREALRRWDEAKTETAAEAAAPAPTAPTASTDSDSEALATLRKLLGATVDRAEVLAIVNEAIAAQPIGEPRAVAITIADLPPVTVETPHQMLERVLRYCANAVWPFLKGPAGSGKTSLAKQVAKLMDRPFYMAARVSSEYAILGFTDAAGKATRTSFREAYEFGGVFLFDEADASDADAFTALNAALENGYCAFPDGVVAMHPDFVCIAAGNTFGRGADAVYCGRQQLDGATLDRFAILEVEVDTELEKAITPDQKWTAYVQKVRAACEATGTLHIVSPRASIKGGKMLAAGETWDQVCEAFIWKGLPQQDRRKVLAAIK